MPKAISPFSRSLWLSALLLGVLAIAFVVYVRAEKQIDGANEVRHQSYALAVELRHTSDDLTRMARTYVVTGDARYKQYYQDILAIRAGTKPRPQDYQSIYWDLMIADGKAPHPDSPYRIALLDLLRAVGITPAELAKLAEAKANSDALVATEFAAFKLVESDPSDASRLRASQMLNDAAYHQAKADIMRPIDAFHHAVEARTSAAVAQATERATQLRILFAVLFILLLWLLRRSYVELNSALGGKLAQVQLYLQKIGQGDFSQPIQVSAKQAHSVLGWVAQTQQQLLRQQQQAEVATAKIQRMSKLYAALSQCNQAIVRCSNEAELFAIICRDAVNFGGMKMAWIGLLDDASELVKPVAAFGSGKEYLENLVISINPEGSKGRGPTGTAMREDSPFWCQDFQHDPATAAWHERGAKFGWAASAALPLHRQGKVVGSLSLYADTRNAFDEEAQKLLIEMATDVDFALDNFVREAQRQQAQLQLQETYELLQTVIEHAPLRIFWKDSALRYLGCNGLFAQDAGKNSPAEMIGKDDFAMGWRDQAALYQADDRAVMETGLPRLAFEEMQTTPTGDTIWLRTSKVPLRNTQNEVIGVLGLYDDITAQKNTEIQLRDTEERYRKAFHVSSDSININRLKDGLYIDVNEGFERISGWRRDEVIGKTSAEIHIWHNPEDRQRLLADIEQQGFCENLEAEFVMKDGSIITGLMSAQTLLINDEQCLVSITRDISERTRMEIRLNKLLQAVEQSPNTIVITDLDANIEYANATFSKVTGYTLEEAVGKNPRILQSGKTPKKTYDELWAHLTAGREWRGELINHRKDGSEYIESAMIAPVRDAHGVITNYLAIKENITEKKLAEARIQQLAYFDQLTGLPNRALLNDRFKFSLSVAQRSGEHLAVMFLDLDHFKNINDTLGHSVGDELLMEISRRLKACLREEDTVSRLGGDEFILLLPGTDQEGAREVATKLVATLQQSCKIQGYELTATASIGIVLYPEDGTDFETLSKHADIAMYRVKQATRNDFCFFTPEMQAHSARTLQLLNALRHALARNELQVHYQPQVAMQDGHILGAEALLRWNNPTLGNVSPAEFIPIAEDSGLILPIGEWVLRTAVQQLKQWLDEGMPKMMMAVNLSAVQFHHPNLPDLVTRILNEAQLPAECLELELTEAVAMGDPQAAIAVMDNLYELGIRMSIDDFGTGYSSLSYLKKFKVYKLKIDQSFVRDISIDPEDKAIVTAIINMASSLGMLTIAEGVETGSQLAFLRLQGCDEVQGYYFSKPLPSAQFAEFVRKGSAE